MNNLPKRKSIRLKNYDYSTTGSYFVTVCIESRKPILWDVGAAICRQPLSKIGKVVDNAIIKIPEIYPMINIDKYCIMPDHIHIIITISTDESGRQIAAPTISTIVGQMKRWVSMQLGYSIWQKSYFDRIIRDDEEYYAVWEYIENNPVKLDTANDIPDFLKCKSKEHSG